MLDSLSPASDHCGTVNWLVSLAGLFRKTLVYCSTNKLDSLVSFFSGLRYEFHFTLIFLDALHV